jgi:hypothetical protein
MNNKFIKISGLILLGLILLITVPWIGEKISDSKKQKPIITSVDLSGFNKESVSKIVIKKASGEEIISFKDNKWFLGEDEVDEAKINQLFQAFSNLKNKEIVSQNEENQSKFDVTKDNNLQLVITQNGKDSTFFVGKSGQSINDFYLRKEGIKTVYLVSGELRNILNWDTASWKKVAGESKK